jgi:glycosyltransferase involved in cell wall biosynthesis
VQRVPNGIALPSFNRTVNPALKATLSKGAGHPIVSMVARLEPRKGQRYLIEAAAQVPEATFVFIGDGPDRAALEAQARAQGVADRVLFLGYREDIPDVLACCNLLVLPSFAEGMPLSILEAMAAGKPVIASAIGGTDEAVVHGETGLLVPPAKPSALAKAIQTVLSDPDLARRLGAAGRERAYQKFSAETMVGNVSRAYEEILSLH